MFVEKLFYTTFKDIEDTIGGGIVTAVICLIWALPMWFLWNTVMPQVFGLPEVGYIAAYAITFLSSIMFGWTHYLDEVPAEVEEQEWEEDRFTVN
jgi:MFS-type transporter involved in bile tolerance (Atg22 family)